MTLRNEYESPINPVSKILGFGVTALGVSDVFYRRIFEEQLAKAVAEGIPFLNGPPSSQTDVMILRYGSADYEETEQRLSDVERVTARCPEYHRIGLDGKGLIPYLKEKQSQVGLIILGDFADIRSGFKQYVENILSLEENKELDASNLQNLKFIIREIDRSNVAELRDFALEWNTSIVVSFDLNTKGNFYSDDGPAPRYCNNKIRLRKTGNDGLWKLEVDGSHYVPGGTYELSYKPYTHFQLTEGELSKMEELSITLKEKEILRAMEGNGPMRLKDIESSAKISHSTVVQRLQALQKPEKGELIITHPDKTYEINKDKEKCW